MYDEIKSKYDEIREIIEKYEASEEVVVLNSVSLIDVDEEEMTVSYVYDISSYSPEEIQFVFDLFMDEVVLGGDDDLSDLLNDLPLN